ncbi:MAG: TA system VapC family ribonuclease toxin [Ilumatobacteraceae bacterium]
MIVLPDVNVLIAIAWPEHTFHKLALDWFDRTANTGWATSSITEAGFIRISANASVVGDPVRPSEACALLAQLRDVGTHEFWVDDIELSISEWFPRDRLVGYRQVTDAHLLALGRRHGGTVATLDRGLVALSAGLEMSNTVLVSSATSKVTEE